VEEGKAGMSLSTAASSSLSSSPTCQVELLILTQEDNKLNFTPNCRKNAVILEFVSTFSSSHTRNEHLKMSTQFLYLILTKEKLKDI
jgi:hypothetical protein